MALAAKRPCTYMGCSALVNSGRCDKHKHVETKRHDERRGTAAQRGYDARWQRYRKQYLHENPWCCMCNDNGLIVPAIIVDHRMPVSGPNDPLFWDTNNHQGLCDDCHRHKTRVIDQRGYGSKKSTALKP